MHLSSKIRGRAVDAVLTYQKPEREYYEIDEAARKKWLRYEVPKIRRAVKKYRGILYFQDESNISLTAYSPDRNPDEKAWNYLKHTELASHQAKNKSELKQLARRKLQSMAKRPALMRGIFFRCCIADLFK